MNLKSFFWLLVAALCVPLHPPVLAEPTAEPNHLRNGDFEFGRTGQYLFKWGQSLYRPSSITGPTDEVIPLSGEKMLKVIPNASPLNGVGQSVTLAVPAWRAAIDGGSVRARFSVYLTSLGSAHSGRISVEAGAEDSVMLSRSKGFVLDNDRRTWEQVQTDWIDVPAGTGSVSVLIHFDLILEGGEVSTAFADNALLELTGIEQVYEDRFTLRAFPDFERTPANLYTGGRFNFLGTPLVNPALVRGTISRVNRDRLFVDTPDIDFSDLSLRWHNTFVQIIGGNADGRVISVRSTGARELVFAEDIEALGARSGDRFVLRNRYSIGDLFGEELIFRHGLIWMPLSSGGHRYTRYKWGRGGLAGTGWRSVANPVTDQFRAPFPAPTRFILHIGKPMM